MTKGGNTAVGVVSLGSTPIDCCISINSANNLQYAFIAVSVYGRRPSLAAASRFNAAPNLSDATRRTLCISPIGSTSISNPLNRFCKAEGGSIKSLTTPCIVSISSAATSISYNIRIKCWMRACVQPEIMSLRMS